MKEYYRTSQPRDGEIKRPPGEFWEVVSSTALMTDDPAGPRPARIVIVILWVRERP